MTNTTHQPAARSDTGQLDFEVEGMTCGSCAVRVQRVLGRQPGVASAEVNFATSRARVAPDGAVDVGGLRAAVERIGYRITPVGSGEKADAEAQAEAAWRRRLVVAVPLAVALVALAMWPGGAMEQPWGRLAAFVLATPVQFWVGWPFLREAARRARRRTANMDTLIAMGTLAAYGFSVAQLVTGGMELYFEASAVIIAFLVLGRYFEARAKGRAGQAIRALLELGAKQARVLQDGREVMVCSGSARARRSPPTARWSPGPAPWTSPC
jgi:copper-transporting P-type ATPase V